jgi:hypothetical protein
MSDTNYSASASPNLAGATTAGGGKPSVGHGTTASGMPGYAKDNLKFMKSKEAEQSSMLQVAKETGGWAFVDTNGLKQAFQRITEHGSSYYTIGYETNDKEMDGKFRRLEVRVAGGGYQLAYRDGYYADDLARSLPFRSKEASLSASVLHGSPTASELRFTVRISPVNHASTAPTVRYALDFDVDAHSILLNQTPDGASHARLEFTTIAYGLDGTRLHSADEGFAFKFRADQHPQVMEQGIAEHLELDLPRGRAALRLVVHDLASNRLGSIEIPLNVRDP